MRTITLSGFYMVTCGGITYRGTPAVRHYAKGFDTPYTKAV